ncbi:MAG: hypothetical protein AAB916_02680 [Patescibacteria group bacterium]
MFVFQPNRGQGLLEAILAIAVFAAIAGVLITMAVGGFRGLEQGGEQTEAEAFAQLGLDATHAVRDREWNQITCTTCVVSDDGTKWNIAAGASQTGLGTNGKFTRSIVFSDVCRDNTTNAITTPCGGSTYNDPHTKEAVVTVTWLTRAGINNTVEKRAYLTNWGSSDKLQDTTAQGLNCTTGACASVEYSTTLGDGTSITLTPQ